MRQLISSRVRDFCCFPFASLAVSDTPIACEHHNSIWHHVAIGQRHVYTKDTAALPVVDAHDATMSMSWLSCCDKPYLRTLLRVIKSTYCFYGDPDGLLSKVQYVSISPHPYHCIINIFLSLRPPARTPHTSSSRFYFTPTKCGEAQGTA
jgi:hypothetical protein